MALVFLTMKLLGHKMDKCQQLMGKLLVYMTAWLNLEELLGKNKKWLFIFIRKQKKNKLHFLYYFLKEQLYTLRAFDFECRQRKT